MKLKILIIMSMMYMTLMSASTEVLSKKDIKKIHKGITAFEEQTKNDTRTIKLKRYFLAKFVKEPSFFENKDPLYNLYLTSMVNNGTPAWLEDTKFVFHTSSSQKYLKRLQKLYKKKYNLELVLYKNPQYKTKVLALAKIDKSKVLRYVQAKVPTTLVQKKVKKTKVKKKKEKREKVQKQVKDESTPNVVRPVQVTTKKEIKSVQKGIVVLEEQIDDETETVVLKRYFLAKFVKAPSFFENKDSLYNLYLTSMVNNGTPSWLEDTKFVFHTASSQKYLKRLQKLYKKKYNLDLVLYKNPNYKTEEFRLAKTDMSKVTHYLHAKIPVALLKEMNEDKDMRALKKQRSIAQNKKLKKEKKRAEKIRLLKEQKKVERKKALDAERKRKHAEKQRRLSKQKKEVKKNNTLVKEKRELEEKARVAKKNKLEESRDAEKKKRLKEEQKKVQETKLLVQKKMKEERELEEKAWAAKKKKLEEERANFEKEKRLLAEREKATENKRSEIRKKEAERLKKLAQEKESTEKKKRLEEEQKKVQQTKILVQKKMKEERELEEKAWAAKKKKLEEERANFEKEKAAENKRSEIRKKEAERLKKLAQEKESAEKKRKQIEAEAWAVKKKKLEEMRKIAAEKEKKKDTLTSDIDKMMKDTSDFKENLERSERIKYY